MARATPDAAPMRRCMGSATFGIEAHEAPASEFPIQPSGKDGLGRMCKPHWDAYADRTQTTVWQIDHLNFRSSATDEDPWTLHGKQKPLEAMARPIRNHHGDVYDAFLGSGTTLIAADKVGRRCFGMKLDPRYVDVVVGRWEAFTGGVAVRADDAAAEAA